MTTLAQEPVRKLQAGQKALDQAEAAALARELPGWTMRDNKLLTQCEFADFDQAMVFVNDVAALASQADHHPDIMVSYKTVRLELTTHKVGGLTRNDFIMADRINGVAGGKCQEIS